MRQNTRLPISVGLALAIPVLALTGCPGLFGPTPTGSGSPSPTPTTTSPTPTPTPAATPTPRFTATDNQYTGQLKFSGAAPTASQSIVLRFTTDNTGTRVATVSTTVDGYFQVKGLSESSYQFLFDAAAAEATGSTTNFTDLFVTDSIAKPKLGADNMTPGFVIDAGWALGPTPAIGGAVTKGTSYTFKWTKLTAQTGVAAGPFEYQVVVKNVADSSKSWSSAYADRAELAWNFKQGSEVDTATGTDIPTGSATVQIKWRTQGTTNGSKAFGQSLPIPFSIN